MKEKLYKLGMILKKIYGYGIFFSLFLGGLSVLAYLVALIVGGDAAAALCSFVYKKLYTYLIVGTDIFVLLGLLSMYLVGEKTMMLQNKDLGE